MTVAAAPASAEPSREDAQAAKVLYERGKKLYEQGRYHEASEKLQMAYEITPHPMISYNLALSEWRAGRWDTALRAARRARSGELEDDFRPQVEARIVAWEAAVQSTEIANEVRERRGPIGDPGASGTASRGLGAAGWTGGAFAAIGVALGAGALYVNYEIGERADEFEVAAKTGGREDYDRMLADLRERQLRGRLLAAGSAAFVTAGATLLYLELSGDSGDGRPSAYLSTSPDPSSERVYERFRLHVSWEF